MKTLLWTFLVMSFLINFTVPSSALHNSSFAEESTIYHESPVSEDESILDGRTLSGEIDCIFVIDNSSTMIEGGSEYSISDTMTAFFSNQKINMHFGLVIFDEKAHMLLPLSSIEEEGFSEKISPAFEDIDFSGQLNNPAVAIEEALYELKNNGRDSAQKVIVLISSGLINMDDQERDNEVRKLLTDSLALDAKKNNILFFSFAVTKSADYLLFQILAERTDSRYFRLPQIQNIDKVLEKLSYELESLTAASISEIKEKEPTSLLTMIIAVVVIVIIALGTVGIVILVLTKGGKKVSKDKKKKVIVTAEPQDSDALSSPNEKKIQNIPEAELRDLSQVTDTDSFGVKVPVTSIGREYGNDIIIPKNTVSSRHATIEYRNGYYYIADHRSSNGSFINGSKIIGEEKLKSGDLLAFDVFKFQFIIPTLTALGQSHGQQKSQYSGEDNCMTILRPQRSVRLDTKSHAKGSPKSPSSEKTKKTEYRIPQKNNDSQSSGEGPRTMLKPRTCPKHQHS